jgi:tight adherence protein B
VSELGFSVILLGILAVFAVAGVILAVFYPAIAGRSKSSKRMATYAGGAAGKRKTGEKKLDLTQQRRKQVQDTLKQLEEKKKSKKRVPLRTRLEVAGVSFTRWSRWAAPLSPRSVRRAGT